MSRNKYIVNSSESLRKFVQEVVPNLYGEGAYLTFTWSTSQSASMSQKALVHIWLREFCAYLLKKPQDDVTETEIDAIKRSTKIHFYQETHETWMVEQVTDPFTPDRKKRDVTSMAEWEPWQMTMFMKWLQGRAAQEGVILKSKGKFRKLASEENNT